MKKKNILFLSITCLLTISGCNNNANSSSNSVNTSSQIISSSSNEGNTEREQLKEMIKGLCNGVKIKGTIDEKRVLLDSYKGKATGETINVKYNAEYVYEVSDENGYSAIVSYQEENNPEVLYINNQVFEGRDGYAYYYDLNYDNTLKKYPLYDERTGGFVNFNFYCLNPFEFLIPEDFTKISDNTYSLNKEKSSFLSSYIFCDINKAFENVIKECVFTVENGQFKSFKLVPDAYHDSFTDYERLEAVYYYAMFEANFEFKEIGSAKVYRIEPKVATEHTERLQNAFNKFANHNFTAHLYALYLDGEGETLGSNHEFTYYDGEEIYMSFVEDQSEHDPVNNQYCKKEANNTLSVLGLPYEKCLPKISEVNAALFTYNPDTNIYSVCDEMITYMGAIAFVPLVSNVSLLLDGYSTKFDIKLDENGEIEVINIEYEYQYSLSTEYGYITLEYYDVDNTKIPHGLKTY